MVASFLPQYDSSLFTEIHQVPTFLSSQENEESIRGILYVAGLITVLHLILLQIVKARVSAKDNKTHLQAAWKASYQITNLLVNLTLGCLGIYYQLFLVPRGESTINKIVGYQHAKLFAIGQIGYQLWALPIGYFFVGETTSMLVHHVAVISVASVSTFLSCGFRYYTPYFYGLIEISSVPLSIMNSFKNNPDWIKSYPSVYSAVRLIFGVAFLLVRVLLWTPIYWDFISLEVMLLYSSKSAMTKIILAVFNLSSLVLTMLQYFWASKIISAMVGGGGSKKPNTEKKEK